MHCICKFFLVEFKPVQALRKFTEITAGIKIKIMSFKDNQDFPLN